jgi:hypothetical protein
MYFAQGVPQGLLSIAIPVWLVSQGVSAGEIGSYLAVILCKDDAFDLENDASRGNGHKPRPGNGYLQEHQFCDAIRHLYVSRQPRACGRIKNLWFDRREFEVLRDKQAATAIDTGDAKTGKLSNTIGHSVGPFAMTHLNVWRAVDYSRVLSGLLLTWESL